MNEEQAVGKARNSSSCLELDNLADHPSAYVRQAVAGNDQASPDNLRKIAEATILRIEKGMGNLPDENWVLATVANQRHAPWDILDTLAREPLFQRFVMDNPAVTPDLIRRIVVEYDHGHNCRSFTLAARHRYATPSILSSIAEQLCALYPSDADVAQVGQYESGYLAGAAAALAATYVHVNTPQDTRDLVAQRLESVLSGAYVRPEERQIVESAAMSAVHGHEAVSDRALRNLQAWTNATSDSP